MKMSNRMNSAVSLQVVLFVSILVTSYGQAVPTRSPNFGNLPCNICPGLNESVGSPDAVIPLGTLPIPSITTSITCAALESAAANAEFRPSECELIFQQPAVATICDCSPTVVTSTPAATITTSTPAAPSVPTIPVLPGVRTPTSSPTSAKSQGGVSGGAIAAIIILILVVAGCGCFFAMKKKDESDEETSSPQTSSDSKITLATTNSNKRTKTIVAPPGKLGIVIDTRKEGPTIVEIKDTSSLINQVSVNDIIVEIDGIDTRSMTSTVVTKLIVDSSDSERTIKVLTQSPSIEIAGVKPSAQKREAVKPNTVEVSVDGMKEKSIMAPAGKLGLVIDSTNHGPRIYKIRDGSPLEGKVAVGDIIVSINDTDVSGMTATAVTILMKDTSSVPRTMILLSNSPDATDTIVSDEKGSQSPSLIDEDIYVSSSIIVENTAKSDELISSTPFLVPAGKNSKTVIAPAGRLLLVIDTTKQGPRVHKIRDGSPMEKLLEIGDIIASIDGTDTRTMSASDITNLMIETSSNERTMIVWTNSALEDTASEVVSPPDNEAAESNLTAASVSVKAEVSLAETGTIVSNETEPNSLPVQPDASPMPVVTEPAVTDANEASSKPPLPPQSSLGINEGKKVKTIVAPAGKLGIVIDTKLEGPVIFKIKDGSPLLGKVEVGDVITDIDGTDTRAMSASGITALMVKTAKAQRKITLLSKQ